MKSYMWDHMLNVHRLLQVSLSAYLWYFLSQFQRKELA